MSELENRQEIASLREKYRVRLTASQRVYLHVRRVIELFVALVALILLAIPFLIVAILQKISSPHEPVFFLQDRIGKGDLPFKVIKFRSMKTFAPKSVATEELQNPERYVSRLGRILRDTSIDELPQLFCVLTGSMSLIGPRPIIPEEEELQFLRWYYGIYIVPPGITGLAQVNGRDLVDTYDKVYYDREYVRNFGPMQDLKILFKSVAVVLGRDGIKDGFIDDKERREHVALMKESVRADQSMWIKSADVGTSATQESEVTA